MNTIEEIYKNLYNDSEQEKLELGEFELLLNGMSIKELLTKILENSLEKSVEMVDDWISKMTEAKYGKIETGGRLHNFGEFLEFASNFSPELNPNPFYLLNKEVEVLRIKYTQFNALRSCKIPNSDTK